MRKDGLLTSAKDSDKNIQINNNLIDVKTFSFHEAKQIGDALGLHRGSLGVEQSTMGPNIDSEGRERFPQTDRTTGASSRI